MNKEDLVNNIALKTGLTKVDAAKALNATLATVEETVRKGDKLTLVGFGSFSAKTRAARTGRNPRTGAVINTPEKTVASAKLTFSI